MAWFNVFRKSGESEQVVADEFDSLAAIMRFASIKERSSAFYQKHRLVVDQALEFVNSVRTESRELGLMLSGSAMPLTKVAQTLRERVGDLRLSHSALEMIEAGARDLLPQFVPILADTSRPAYLDECKGIIKAACDKASRRPLAQAGIEQA